MTISLKHAFTSTKSDGPDNTIVQPSDWNDEHTLTLAAGKVLGRTAGGTAGAVEELPIAVDSTGNVGIGTSSPGQKLTVAGTIESTTGGIKFPDGTTQSTVGLTSFNTRTGAVTLSSTDVTNALTYTPVNKAGDTMTGFLTLSGNATSSLHAVTKQQLDLKASIASPTFTGSPSCPTAATGSSNTQIANTAFVNLQIAASAPKIVSQTFNASGTWTKPSGYSANSRVFIQAWGGGGAGGRGGSSASAGGGGGGYTQRWCNLSDMGATETVTIGAGGIGRSTGGIGAAGSNTTVTITNLSTLTAYAGGGGGGGTTTMAAGGGAGGGMLSAGTSGAASGVSGVAGKPFFVTDSTTGAVQGSASNNSTPLTAPDCLYHGGGGAAAALPGGTSVWGGGGGGSSNVAGTPGTSLFGGSGGAGGASGGTSGSQPAGGGGGAGSSGTSGSGGDGRVIITVFPV